MRQDLKTVVVGSLTDSVGRPLDLYIDTDVTELEYGPEGIPIEVSATMLGSHFLVDIHGVDNISDFGVDTVFRIAKYVVEPLALAHALENGYGCRITLEKCRSSDGRIFSAENDGTKRPDGTNPNWLTINWSDLQALQSHIQEFKFAVRDFNNGLLDREDCPFYFKRALETSAKCVTEQWNYEDRPNWPLFHELVGTSRDEMKTIEEFAGHHRHGGRKPFQESDHRAMMDEAKRFLSLAANYLVSKHKDGTCNCVDRSIRKMHNSGTGE